MRYFLALLAFLFFTIPAAAQIGTTQIPCIETLGGGPGAADNTPALDMAVATGKQGVAFCSIGSNYRFATQPAAINRSFGLYGAMPGIAFAYIERTFSQADPTIGLFHFTGSQFAVDGLMIYASAGTGGTGISYVPASISGTATISNTRITAFGGTWARTLYVDGSALTSPLGARSLFLSNVVTFGGSLQSVYLKSIDHFGWFGGSVNAAGGPNGNLVITGTPTVWSQENTISIDSLSSDLSLDYVSDLTVIIGRVYGTVRFTSNVNGVVGSGRLKGGAPTGTGYWSASSWRDGRNYIQSPF